jgi:hypothetical protein
MKSAGKKFRPSISILVSLAVAVMFSLSSFAAPDLPDLPEELMVAQDCTGTISFTKGTVTVNGNPVQSGATILPGSTVVAGNDADGSIDFGASGRVSFNENTGFAVSCTPTSVTVRPTCSKVEVDVTKGQVTVGAATLNAGQKGEFGSGVEIVGGPGSDFQVGCGGGGGPLGGFIGPGTAGILALIGVGAAVAIGVAVGDEDSVDVGLLPPASPSAP